MPVNEKEVDFLGNLKLLSSVSFRSTSTAHHKEFYQKFSTPHQFLWSSGIQTQVPESLYLLHNSGCAFFLATINAIPSTKIESLFNVIFCDQRLCPCGIRAVETIAHMFLHCNFYKCSRGRILCPILQWFMDRTMQMY